MVNRWRYFFSLAFVAVLIAAGCGEEKAPARAKPAAPAAAPAPAAKPPAPKTELPSIFGDRKDDYSYNPIGKRDPFVPFRGEVIQLDAGGPPKSPLEQFNLTDLKLTAIVWGISSPRALLQAPDGQSYIVRKNMRIGKNRGRISKITKQKLFVEEENRDPNGKLLVRETVLALRQDGKSKNVDVSFEDEEEEE